MKRLVKHAAPAVVALVSAFVCRGDVAVLNAHGFFRSMTLPAPLNDDAALGLIANLNEVKEFGAKLSRLSAGAVRVILMIEKSPEPNGRFWIIYVCEDHDDHIAVWNRFRIDAVTREISVVADFADGTHAPLKEWRVNANLPD